MFRLRSYRSRVSKLFVIISILLLLGALLLLFWGNVGSGNIPGFGLLLKGLTVLMLLYVSYAMVLKRIGIIRITARSASIIIAIIDFLVGYFYAGEFVIFAGIAMFAAWLLLSI